MHVQLKCCHHKMRGCSDGVAVEPLSCRCLRSISVRALPAAAGDVTCCSAAAYAGGIQGVAEEKQPEHTRALLHSFAIVNLLPQAFWLRRAINMGQTYPSPPILYVALHLLYRRCLQMAQRCILRRIAPTRVR